LNYNTLDLGSTTNNLMTEQVLYNLSNFIDSDLAYPAQIVIGSGTASTSDTASVSVTAPLSNAVTDTAQIVSTAAMSPSVAKTNINQGVASARSLGVIGTDVHSQNWAYAPVTNPFQALRLMALYRFVVDHDKARLKRDYPKIYKAVSHSRTACLRDKEGSIDADGKKATGSTLGPNRDFTHCLTSYGSDGATVTQGADTDTTMEPDPYYFRRPACVLCTPLKSMKEKGLVVNPRLKGEWPALAISTGRVWGLRRQLQAW
jgi:hypothetical protein